MMISIKYASHLPVLTKIFEATTGDILELGVGIYSTPYLHWMCFERGRKLSSYESDQKWAYYFRDSRRVFHDIHHTENWDDLKIDQFWDFVFIDHAPDIRRGIEAGRLAQHAKYVIIHDSEDTEDHKYNYSKIYPLFKYRYDYQKAVPRTTVLSNFIDPNVLFT